MMKRKRQFSGTSRNYWCVRVGDGNRSECREVIFKRMYRAWGEIQLDFMRKIC